MRHAIFGRRAAAGLGLTAALLLGACASLPDSVDKDLVNEWPGVAEPQGWEPGLGTCHKEFRESLSRSRYEPVDCGSSHYYETVFVGSFGDGPKSPPGQDSDEIKTAWQECDKQVTAFLGDNWRYGDVWFGVSLPSAGNWAGGARWYLCQLGATERFTGDAISLDRSLKDEFGAESTLRLSCFSFTDDDSETVACDQAHNGEFAGVFKSSLSWDELQDYDDNRDTIHTECRRVIADYVGVPKDGNLKYRTGSYVVYPRQDRWESGDRSIRCFIYLDSKNVKGSLKGKGTSGLPINYV